MAGIPTQLERPPRLPEAKATRIALPTALPRCIRRPFHRKTGSFQLDVAKITQDEPERIPLRDILNLKRPASRECYFVPCKRLPSSQAEVKEKRLNKALAQLPASEREAFETCDRAIRSKRINHLARRASTPSDSTSTSSSPQLKPELKRSKSMLSGSSSTPSSNFSYFQAQNPTELNEDDKELQARLINWMSECLVVLRLPARVFPLSVIILNQSLKAELNPDQLHEQALVSMWIASKVETCNHLRLQELFRRVGHAKFSEKSLLDLERQTLHKINFDVGRCFALDKIEEMLKVLLKAFKAAGYYNTFQSLAFLSYFNYASAISQPGLSFSELELATLCVKDSLQKYSAQVLDIVSSVSKEPMEGLQSEINATLKDQSNQLSQFSQLMARYIVLADTGVIKTKWVGTLVSQLLERFMEQGKQEPRSKPIL